MWVISSTTDGPVKAILKNNFNIIKWISGFQIAFVKLCMLNFVREMTVNLTITLHYNKAVIKTVKLFEFSF